MAGSDAVVFATPTRFGVMASAMKKFGGMVGGLWARNALVGKVGAVFSSTGSQHGGHEAALLTTQVPLQHFAMIVVGLPCSFASRTSRAGITLWRGDHRRR